MTIAPEITKIFPRWTRTIGALDRSLALIRSQCRTCGVQLREEPAQLAASFGASASLIDRQGQCRMVGCTGPVFYLAARSYGRTWLPLIERPELLERVNAGAQPVNAVTLGLAPLSRRSPR